MLATEEQMIQKSPGRIGGAACIRSTRIAVWMLVEDRSMGVSDHTILTDYYPSLTAEDLKAAWDYYETNREEVDEAIRRNNQD